MGRLDQDGESVLTGVPDGSTVGPRWDSLEDIVLEASLYGRPLGTIFDLLGDDEPALTNALGWALAESPKFRSRLIKDIFGDTAVNTVPSTLVRLQPDAKSSGFTDVELVIPGDVMLIVEAKKGWALPSIEQLTKYVPRFDDWATRRRAFVILTEATQQYARSKSMPTQIQGVSVVHRRWTYVIDEAVKASAGATHAEKRLLAQLARYLREQTSMRRLDNLVYVVSLSSEKPEGASISFIDVVEKKGLYFHPFGRGWPKEPPSYMGFRYGGRLHSVRFVEEYKIVSDLAAEIPEMEDHSKIHPGEHFLYRLGPPVEPMKTVSSKEVWPSGRVWSMIDVLLTADTIGDAVKASEARRKLA